MGHKIHESIHIHEISETCEIYSPRKKDAKDPREEDTLEKNLSTMDTLQGPKC